MGRAGVKWLDLASIPAKPQPMQRLSLRRPIDDSLSGAILALGNFDGFHLGHQAVVGRAIQRGAHERRPVIVATFDPHPVAFFRPETPPFRLTTLDQREELFGHAGADAMLVFDFDADLAATSADSFVAELLAERLKVSGVVTGSDFTFGRGRAGNAAVLSDLGADNGILAETVAPVMLNETRISSGLVREALRAGDPGTATRLLTRPFAIRGVVIDGDKRGREFGWPTANVELGDYQRPAYGIYAVRVRLDDGSEHDGVGSLGVRPMFSPPKELLEVHLFDFDDHLYGRTIETSLVAYLRPEARFESVDELKNQMAQDAEDARAALA